MLTNFCKQLIDKLCPTSTNQQKKERLKNQQNEQTKNIKEGNNENDNKNDDPKKEDPENAEAAPGTINRMDQTCAKYMGVDKKSDLWNPFAPYYIDLPAVTETVTTWQDHFYQNLHIYKYYRFLPELEKNRTLTDGICCAFFALLFFGFIGAVGFSAVMVGISTHGFKLPNEVAVIFFEGINQQAFVSFLIVIATAVLVALVLSIIVYVAFQHCETVTVYTLVFSGVAAMFGLSAFLSIYQPRSQITISVPQANDIPQLASLSGMTITRSQIQQASKAVFAAGILYGLTFFGFRKYLNQSGNIICQIKKLVHSAKDNNNKQKQKKQQLRCQILCHILTMVIVSLVFLGLWSLGFYCFYSLAITEGRSNYQFMVFCIVWLVVLLVFNFVFYYACVFVNTYVLMKLTKGQLQKQDFSFSQPYWQLIRYHLGTIMLASLLAIFTNLLNLIFVIASLRNSDNKIVAYISNITRYLICMFTGAIQVYVKVINSNAVSVCALTGEALVDASKTAGFVCFENYPHFSISAFASLIIRMGVVIGISTIPALGGTIYILVLTENMKIIILGFFIMWLMTSLIATVVLELYFDSLNTMYIVYKMNVITQPKSLRKWNKGLTWQKSSSLRELRIQFGGCSYLQLDQRREKRLTDKLKKAAKGGKADKAEEQILIAADKTDKNKNENARAILEDNVDKNQQKKQQKEQQKNQQNTQQKKQQKKKQENLKSLLQKKQKKKKKQIRKGGKQALKPIQYIYPKDNQQVFRQILTPYIDSGKGDQNIYDDDPVIKGRKDEEVDLSLNLVFPKRKAIFHCQQCKIRFIMNITDDANQVDYYQFWPIKNEEVK